jgi:hypothetical protein
MLLQLALVAVAAWDPCCTRRIPAAPPLAALVEGDVVMLPEPAPEEGVVCLTPDYHLLQACMLAPAVCPLPPEHAARPAGVVVAAAVRAAVPPSGALVAAAVVFPADGPQHHVLARHLLGNGACTPAAVHAGLPAGMEMEVPGPAQVVIHHYNVLVCDVVVRWPQVGTSSMLWIPNRYTFALCSCSLHRQS